MKIKIVKDKWDTAFWLYNTKKYSYTQNQFDYIFKYLDFDKLNKYHYIIFNDNKTKEWWFKKTYIDNRWLNDIYNDSLEGYEWLKQNWGKGEFKIFVWYVDKQKLKTVINKVINVELK